MFKSTMWSKQCSKEEYHPVRLMPDEGGPGHYLYYPFRTAKKFSLPSFKAVQKQYVGTMESRHNLRISQIPDKINLDKIFNFIDFKYRHYYH